MHENSTDTIISNLDAFVALSNVLTLALVYMRDLTLRSPMCGIIKAIVIPQYTQIHLLKTRD